MPQALEKTHPTAPSTQRSAFSRPAAQFGNLAGVTAVPEKFSGPVIQDHCKTTNPSLEAARCYSEQAVSEPDTLKLSALIRPCTSETLQPMGSIGSPFDAPLPRFQQAAAHLSSSLGSSNSKKPPLSPSLPESKSLKAYDDRQERACLAEFAQSKSLERSTSFTRRRLSRQDLNFPQAASLASVLEHSTECDLVSIPSSSTPEPLASKSVSLISADRHLINPTRSFFAQRLPGILAATGMLLLLVMSVVALWPPTDGSPLVPRVQAAQASFPKRLFDKLFKTELSEDQMRLEHFTAAQGAGLGTVGFGLEQPNTPTLAQPADDFESFVSTHLGFEPEEQVAGAQRGQSRADFMTAYQSATEQAGSMAGGFGEQLPAAVPSDLQGRKELESDGAASTSASVNSNGMSTGSNGGVNGIGQAGTALTGLSSATLNAQGTNQGSVGKKGSVGVIPQETILPAGSDPLSSSTGIPDPVNLKGAATLGTVAANPQTTTVSSTTGSSGGTNNNGQVNSGTTSGIAGSQSMAGHIAVQPNTGSGINTGSGATSAASTNSGGTSASGLRHNQGSGSGRAAGTTAGSTQPLDSMTGGQVTSVSTSELSSTQRTGSLVGQRESTNSFKPLSGRKLKM
ncbi:hypothetical protein CVIRNUC_009700 [Coccomyxa viridis]|uniref:Uncharacterized protein n=1 Tax=Coccomyxa viridis TaxID=1274662 RepID=A0AAV1IIJ2_9CHLO|nr:hypothetical protein CVIRNUC_009700 [Coccomyxa viridis]